MDDPVREPVWGREEWGCFWMDPEPFHLHDVMGVGVSYAQHYREPVPGVLAKRIWDLLPESKASSVDQT